MKMYESEIGALGQVGWYLPLQRVIVKSEFLQSKQIANFPWNFTIEGVVLEFDGSKKAEVAYVR